ncbi:MAG: MetQ/NlpA family ABC transporter substrate-binding protein [Coriobacteriia bacterium]|nr:MetQ/NlpA family ABC transporter substrate-binding protein [Coriobacteriia bacterium]
MKRFARSHKRAGLLSVLVLLVLSLALVAGCGGGGKNVPKGDDSGDTGLKTIKVGASPTPHAKILEHMAVDLAAEGYKLEIVNYDDYVLPNTDLDAGEIQANYFQHQPYLDKFNEEKGTDIISVAAIHFEPLGLYAGKARSIEELSSGAKIAVPNDPTNEARALLLLEAKGLIEIKSGAGLEATVRDITKNDKNIQFVELEAAAIPRTLAEVDLAVINGNYALDAALSPNDLVASEAADSLAATTFANIIAVKAGNESDPGVKALAKVLTSAKAKAFIEEEFGGAVVPVF